MTTKTTTTSTTVPAATAAAAVSPWQHFRAVACMIWGSGVSCRIAFYCFGCCIGLRFRFQFGVPGSATEVVRNLH